MAKDKLIEGKSREMGKSKVWRLTKKGRELTACHRQPVPFQTMKINHILAVGQIFMTLYTSGRLQYWQYEPSHADYYPDAFYLLGGKAFLLEVQRSPISSARWAKKWAQAARYFDSGTYVTAPWQVVRGATLTPRIVVVTSQMADTVAAGCELPIKIMEEFKI